MAYVKTVEYEFKKRNFWRGKMPQFVDTAIDCTRSRTNSMLLKLQQNYMHATNMYSESIDYLHEKIRSTYGTVWVKVLHPIRHKIGHFRHALPSQSLDSYWENKIKTRRNNHKIYNKPKLMPITRFATMQNSYASGTEKYYNSKKLK